MKINMVSHFNFKSALLLRTKTHKTYLQLSIRIIQKFGEKLLSIYLFSNTIEHIIFYAILSRSSNFVTYIIHVLLHQLLTY
jgi:hypothetical protein